MPFDTQLSEDVCYQHQCSPMADGPSDISGNDWHGPVNSSPAADRMSDEIFGENHLFCLEITDALI